MHSLFVCLCVCVSVCVCVCVSLSLSLSFHSPPLLYLCHSFFSTDFSFLCSSFPLPFFVSRPSRFPSQWRIMCPTQNKTAGSASVWWPRLHTCTPGLTSNSNWWPLLRFLFAVLFIWQPRCQLCHVAVMPDSSAKKKKGAVVTVDVCNGSTDLLLVNGTARSQRELSHAWAESEWVRSITTVLKQDGSD